jgi:peptidoglycan/LPS O-acetylase OafA/YrhL
MRMSADEARRNVGIDLLRAIAILSVVAHHWVNSGLASPERSALGTVFVQMAGHGYYGVTLFFTLSGFLITRMTMMREPDLFRLSVRDFYIRRVARIQPLFLGIVAFGVLMLMTGDANTPMFSQTYYQPEGCFAGDFWLSLFTFTFNWDRIARGTFCGQHWDVMWSLAVEEQFYLAFPLVLVWARNRKRLLRILLTVVLVGIALRVASDVLRLSLFAKVENSFLCFDTMALGVLMAVFGEHLPRGRAVCGAVVTLGTVALAVAFYRSGVVFLIVGGCLFLHGARYGELFEHRAWSLLARFGQLSYGIYLLHPTAVYLASSFIRGWGVLTGFVVVAAIVICLAEITYRFYEAPGNAWIRATLIRPARALPAEL